MTLSESGQPNSTAWSPPKERYLVGSSRIKRVLMSYLFVNNVRDQTSHVVIVQSTKQVVPIIMSRSTGRRSGYGHAHATVKITIDRECVACEMRRPSIFFIRSLYQNLHDSSAVSLYIARLATSCAQAVYRTRVQAVTQQSHVRNWL